ncbi:hypothetical protein RJ639_016556 [Escallonia herrerae]|uniref:Zinc finger ZPR1-type domain-containing protein n=1 Tax=Escallonia herrerae TaxID=1293975 RepID=A0AA88VD33_9ASTE|nr:hypothetical protein RJ639_016556 [Escallonia herrerae]
METSRDPIADVRSVVEAISTDATDDAPLYQLESLCMRCGQNILLSAFECPNCGERNNEVQFAGEIQPQGCRYRLDFSLGDRKMLNRQVVKSESATITIPELDFEIPPEAQRGSLSTRVDPQTAEALDQFLVKLKACATGDSSFTFILDDPAGNSFIENPYSCGSLPSKKLVWFHLDSPLYKTRTHLMIPFWLILSPRLRLSHSLHSAQVPDPYVLKSLLPHPCIMPMKNPMLHARWYGCDRSILSQVGMSMSIQFSNRFASLLNVPGALIRELRRSVAFRLLTEALGQLPSRCYLATTVINLQAGMIDIQLKQTIWKSTV